MNLFQSLTSAMDLILESDSSAGNSQFLFHLLTYRVFSHDVTAAILVSQNNETVAMFPKSVLWELNSFLMQTLSFVPINLHICWPREWKYSIDFIFLCVNKCGKNRYWSISNRLMYCYEVWCQAAVLKMVNKTDTLNILQCLRLLLSILFSCT